MITPELVDFFDSVIENWTPKQKIIAQDLIVDKTYQIIKIYDNKQPKLYLRNVKIDTMKITGVAEMVNFQNRKFPTVKYNKRFRSLHDAV